MVARSSATFEAGCALLCEGGHAFCEVVGAEGGACFAAYMAALDREEAAATAYAGVLADGERWLRRASALRAAPRRFDGLGRLLARQGLPSPGI